MSSLALLFVGAVLFVNGLVFLDRVDSRAAVPINLLVGTLLVFVALTEAWSASTLADGQRTILFGATGFTLFGFTYLTVAANTLFGGTGAALGYYCGWASAIAAVLAAVNFTAVDGALMGWLWAAWVVLFLAFALALLSGKPVLATAAGILAVLQSLTTATLPALAMIDGSWGARGPWTPTVNAVVQCLGIAIYIIVVTTGTFRGQNRAPSRGPEHAAAL